MARIILQWTLLLGLSIFATVRSRRPEQAGIAILLGMALLDLGYHQLVEGPGQYASVDAFHMFNDMWALVAFVWLALSADRFWPLCTGGLQLVAALSHLLRSTETEMLQLVYAMMIRVPFWAQIGVLFFAIIRHRVPRRVRS